MMPSWFFPIVRIYAIAINVGFGMVNAMVISMGVGCFYFVGGFLDLGHWDLIPFAIPFVR
jgi:hypothetical protein